VAAWGVGTACYSYAETVARRRGLLDMQTHS
jgi:hypothetical protein